MHTSTHQVRRSFGLYAAMLVALLLMASPAPAQAQSIQLPSTLQGASVTWYSRPLAGPAGWVGGVHVYGVVQNGSHAGMVVQRLSTSMPAGLYAPAISTNFQSNGAPLPGTKTIGTYLITNTLVSAGYELGTINCQHLLPETTGQNPQHGGVNNATHNAVVPPPGVLKRGPVNVLTTSMNALHSVTTATWGAISYVASGIGKVIGAIGNFFGSIFSSPNPGAGDGRCADGRGIAHGKEGCN